jgi:cell division protein FtsI/penicillin-binding protein 2
MDLPEPRGRPRTAEVLIVLVAVGLLGLLGRLAYIQGAMRPRLEPIVARQQKGQHSLPARRGMILDRRGRILAGSDEAQTVYADPTLIDDLYATAERVAPILDMTAAEVVERIQQAVKKRPGTRYVRLKRHVDEVDGQAVSALRERGIDMQADSRRRYPMGSLACHILGFVGDEGHGLEGVEAQHDQLLAGHNGYVRSVNDAARRWIWLRPDGYRPPRDGRHVVLTIDATIQSIVETELADAVGKYNAPSGVAIVLAPKTGDVLGLACWPKYDPARPQDSPKGARRNQALTDPVEPGSTFKPFIAATAIHEEAVRWNENIFCENGMFMMGRRRILDMHAYGGLPFETVIVKSSNIGMAKIGERLGNERLHAAVRNFGFGETTGIDLIGEGPGIVRRFSSWTHYSTGSIPMGQEISVTPIQLVRAFSVFANGGLLVQPRVVKSLLDVDGRVIEDRSEPVILRRVLPEPVIRSTRSVLAKVINEGTGRRAQLERWQVIGKTGTAQIARKDGRGYERNAHVASFVCAAPAADPEVAVLVMIHRPKGAVYTGGRVSAPAAKEIVAKSLAYLGVPGDKSAGTHESSRLQVASTAPRQ